MVSGAGVCTSPQGLKPRGKLNYSKKVPLTIKSRGRVCKQPDSEADEALLAVLLDAPSLKRDQKKERKQERTGSSAASAPSTHPLDGQCRAVPVLWVRRALKPRFTLRKLYNLEETHSPGCTDLQCPLHGSTWSSRQRWRSQSLRFHTVAELNLLLRFAQLLAVKDSLEEKQRSREGFGAVSRVGTSRTRPGGLFCARGLWETRQRLWTAMAEPVTAAW